MTQHADGPEQHAQPPHAPDDLDAPSNGTAPPPQQQGWAPPPPQDPGPYQVAPPWHAQDHSGQYPALPDEYDHRAAEQPPRYFPPHPDPYPQPAPYPGPTEQPPPDPAQYGYPPAEPNSSPPRPDLVNPFIEQSNAIPRTGVRRVVYRATFGAVNLGPSDVEQAARARRERVQRALHGSWRVVVMSIKGGVGKTTTAAMLGRTLAEWRGDRVVALDTNPDMGTLGDRLVGATDLTVRGLLAHEARAPIQQVAEVNRFTNLAGRLHVLANEQDPAVSEDFTGTEYVRTLSVLERFYNVIVADCGTGVLRPWVRDMLMMANTLVVVAEPKGDAATRAAGTLDWIEQHGFHDLVNRSVAVINYRSPTPKSLDVNALTSFFAQRCRDVCTIRYDEHLDLGVQIQYDRIPDAPTEAYVADDTKEDYLELAATIADEFR